jgi:hypothetical protein
MPADPPIVLPPNAAMAAAIDNTLASLATREGEEFLLDLDKWAVTVNSGRIRDGMLNRRYEFCVLDAHPPLSWIVGAYDTTTHQFVLAALLPEGDSRPDRDRAGRLCAQALNEPVRQIEA